MATQPLPSYHFMVQWGGKRTGFTEVSGLTIEHDVIHYREGGSPVPAFVLMPGLRKYGTVTLKRGIMKGDNDFYEWMNTIRMSTVEKRDVLIQLLDEQHNPVMVWKLKNCWPSKLITESLKAGSSEVAIESLDLVYEELAIETT